ncbi:hypothetical protein [Microbacterium sp. SORGH_AS_0421]|uniref:hypothetical protein n=1 Tax=Microbacterium sp. SORGH_AS_0421 TaxID=3041768 RepID=UPI00278F02D4|nr:hypothetical protein [Microbacterium sp. SORGH_AS_0421]MDQ1177947.1 hypothetical protein [Microbacterium sp. SORGH_AS_0421]
MMVPGKRKAVLAAAGLILTAVLSGCSIGGPTGQQRADELATQLERSELGVSSAEATYLTSFSGDLTVSVVLDPDVVQPGYTVFAETLGPILGMVAQSAKQMNVGGVGFYAEDDGGIHVSMVQAADELGIAEAVDGSSLSLTGERLEILAKQ